jgi:transposase
MQSPSVLSEAQREQRLSAWSASSGVDLARLDEGQRAVVVAALIFLGFVGGLAALRRVVAYLLAHCGMGLGSAVIGAVVGTSDRAVRKARQYPPRDFWRRLQKSRRGHPPPKLLPEHVGLVAKFLSEHKRCSVAELLGFIHKSFGVQMERHTLRRFLERYGLGCLRKEAVVGSPLFSAARPMEVRSH